MQYANNFNFNILQSMINSGNRSILIVGKKYYDDFIDYLRNNPNTFDIETRFKATSNKVQKEVIHSYLGISIYHIENTTDIITLEPGYYISTQYYNSSDDFLDDLSIRGLDA